MSNKSTAQNTLCYYFRLLGKESGVGWNSDNDSEIASIVEAIFGEIDSLRKEVDALKICLGEPESEKERQMPTYDEIEAEPSLEEIEAE